MNPIMDDILMHYGVKRRPGRYSWGSGENPYQHDGDFLTRVEELEVLGESQKEIAEELKASTADLRIQVRVAKRGRRALQAERAKSLRGEGKTLGKIAKIMGYGNDSPVHTLLNENTASNKNKALATTEALKKELAVRGALDMGEGVKQQLGVSKGVPQEIPFILETESYNRHGVDVPQVNDLEKWTITPVIPVPDTRQRDAYQSPDIIKSVGDCHSAGGSASRDKRECPASIDSGWVKIRYDDEGGTSKDGVIELCRGVTDLDLGDPHYVQVRIPVDGTHYLKGMAMCSDDMPGGADIVLNTNKHSGTPKMDIMKKIQEDPDNPFGAFTRANGQSYYPDPHGKYIDPIIRKRKSLSAINKLKEEGSWGKMGKNSSSQFLSKQLIKLIQKQPDLTYADAADEFAEICPLNNPTIKRKLLMSLADGCDSAAIHLKATILPRQSTQVTLPITKMKEAEIYAPNYRSGGKVILIRYSHGGTFGILELTINNKNQSAISILGKNIRDAVGVNPKVTERLSGADSDGDQAVVIPMGEKVSVRSTPVLDGLKDSDPKVEYSTEGKTGVRLLSKTITQIEMGKVSNLITDVILKEAPEEEITKAVKHSMVVIDATKHKLDYKRSEVENDILTLCKRWQGYTDPETEKEASRASTLFSRRRQSVDVSERQGSDRIDKETGEIIYKESECIHVGPKSGKTVPAVTKIKFLEKADDVRTLSSGTVQGDAYADYTSRMKALTNRAGLGYLATPTSIHNTNVAKTYAPEVTRLTSTLKTAQLSVPREREAQCIVNAQVKTETQTDNITDRNEILKVRCSAISDARVTTGASGRRTRITISGGEWETVQAGAVSDATLKEIPCYSDLGVIRERVTPRASTQLSVARINRIKTMANSSCANAEIADILNLSSSVVSKYLSE